MNMASAECAMEMLSEEQALFFAMGQGYIEPAVIRTAVLPVVMTIFKLGSDQRFMTTLRDTPVVNIARGIGTYCSKLMDVLDVGSSSPDAMPHGLRDVVRVLAQAEADDVNRRQADAFLKRVIVWDMLFGDSQQISETVSKRVAALLSPRDLEGFRSIRKKAKKIYTQRSKLVHEGQQPNHETAEELKEMSIQVLKTVLLQQPFRRASETEEFRARLRSYLDIEASRVEWWPELELVEGRRGEENNQ
ncbi:MAG: hypothetical protein EOP84_35365 [Verrucomicrobiaceae bacterium]|nr:MAG: hypothetical protein EOP84_35365 [Verrucomicrobiaceae bacterium]